MATYRGSEIIAEYIIKEKVPYIMGYAGHGAIGFLDGVYDRTDKIKIIWPRVETAAGFMAATLLGFIGPRKALRQLKRE